MKFRKIIIHCTTVLVITGASNLQAGNDETDHVWMLKKPGTSYWQAPERTDTALPSANKEAFSQSEGSQTGMEKSKQSLPVYNTSAERTIPVPPAPTGPFKSSSLVPDNAASAYNLPGYGRYHGRNEYHPQNRPGQYVPQRRYYPERGRLQSNRDRIMRPSAYNDRLHGDRYPYGESRLQQNDRNYQPSGRYRYQR